MTQCNIFTVILCALMINSIQSSYLLNITKETLKVGRTFRIIAEKPSTYETFDDVYEQIKNIYDIFQAHKTKISENLRNTVRPHVCFKNTTLKGIVEEMDDFKRIIKYVTDDIIERNPEKSLINITKTAMIQEMFYHEYFDFTEENYFNLSTKPSILETLNTIHKLHEKIDLKSGRTFFDIVIESTQVPQYPLQSQQQALFNELKSIAITDAVGFIIIQYSYAILKICSDAYQLIPYLSAQVNQTMFTWKEKDVIRKMKNLEIEFAHRNAATCTAFAKAINNLSREVWNNDNGENTYTKMEYVFQTYVVNEVDLNKDASCRKDCPAYNQTKIYGCYDKKICAHQRTCNGNLWECNNQIAPEFKICPEVEDKISRYLYIQVDGKTYGAERYYRCSRDMITTKSWPRGFYKCSYCMCTCDNSNLPGDRYFNLRSSVSDLHSNFVITDARYAKENNVIHIQIQQGKLLPNGIIDQNTLEWKPIDNYTIFDKNITNEKDYHTITWKERTILLDEIDSKHHVLTGLKFSLERGNLKLEVRLTQYDFKTGKLENSYWTSSLDNDLSERTEIKLNNHNKNAINIKGSQYLRFTVSDFELDLGQNTLPFIETYGIQHNPPVPLSGAGIIHKSKENKGHFLGLKLFTYDIETLL